MTIFNVSQNMTQLTDLLPLTDSATQGLFGLIVLIVIFFGIGLIFRGSKEGFLASAVVTFIVAPMLKYLGIIADWVLWTSGAILAICLIVIVFSGRGTGG